MKSVKIYGSGVKPLSLDLNNKDSIRLKVGSILKIENHLPFHSCINVDRQK